MLQIVLDNKPAQFILPIVHPQAANSTWLPLGYDPKGFFIEQSRHEYHEMR